MRLRLTTDPVIGYVEVTRMETEEYETARYTYPVDTCRLALVPFLALEWEVSHRAVPL